uniref:Uncharacterized protein n=1 Tax=Rhodnius prolixus TaxID=13249 RepID=T1HL14_RHOPR
MAVQDGSAWNTMKVASTSQLSVSQLVARRPDFLFKT